MKKHLSAFALLLATVSPMSAAHATGTQTYDVCGGNNSYASWQGFAFCAAVQVGVTQKSANVWNVAIQIANMSGVNGSYWGSVFTQIGIDNIPGSLANPANIAVSQNGQILCSNPYNNQSTTTNCWNVKQDVNADGGVNVDFLDQSANGFNRDISSLCLNDQTLLYTCLAASPVTLSFDINSNFNPATQGQLYIKAASWIGTAECETGLAAPTAIRCSNATFAGGSVTATPEPATFALFGTGLLGLGGTAGLRKRRRRSEEEAA